MYIKSFHYIFHKYYCPKLNLLNKPDISQVLTRITHV